MRNLKRRERRALLVCAGVWLCASGRPLADAPRASRLTVTTGSEYGRLPMAFEPNRGQTDPHVKFVARGPDYALFLTAGETVFALSGGRRASVGSMNPDPQPAAAAVADRGRARAGHVLRLRLVGAAAQPRAEALAPLPGTVSYFIGSDAAGWRTGVPTYARVGYRDVYPGIDVFYYGTHQELEYDFVVRPGADPTAIAIDFAGAEQLAIDSAGDLVLRTAVGTIRHRKPVVYQEGRGGRRPVDGRFVMQGPSRVAFAVGEYDVTEPLVIDPVLVYSSFVGGQAADEADGIAVDAAGAAYVVGSTFSADLPTTAGAFDTTFGGGGQDVFVAKLNPTGSASVYVAYLGGTNFDEGHGIAVDVAGAAYVTGGTSSADFPVTPGALDTTFNGTSDVFVAKLDADGSALSYSTFLGDAGDDRGRGITVDGAGNAYVTGITSSAAFPTTAGAFATLPNGAEDAFVAKVDLTGSALTYSTLLGGSDSDFGYAVAVNPAGAAYVTGRTLSSNFPTTAGTLDTTLGGTADAFVTKVDPLGATLGYSTYLGGSAFDQGFRIALDPFAATYVVGLTLSSDFTTTPGAFDRFYGGGGGDVFVAKLNGTGSALGYATFLGGGGLDFAGGVAVDPTGFSCVTGATASSDFPTTADAPDRISNGGNDVFVVRLNAAGTALAYSTYLGGSGADEGRGVATDTAGACYVTGLTASSGFPTTAGAFDQTFNDTSGGADVFLAKVARPAEIGPVVLDQSFEPNDYLGVGVDGVGYALGGNLSQAVAQTFTVGVSGRLVRVEVKLGGFGGPTQPIVADIRRTVAGRPIANDADAVFVVDLPSSAVPQSPNPAGYVAIDLSAAPIPVVAGDVLAVVLWSGEQIGSYGWQAASTGNPPASPLYPWGARFFRNTSNPAWSSAVMADSGFRTFVDATAVPVDHTAPQLTVPGPLSALATSAFGATVTFAASAIDDMDPTPSVTCTPPSGSTFAPGVTLVTCTATDSAGNSSQETFTVTVLDDARPLLDGVPPDLVLEAAGPGGAIAIWPSPTASDAIDPTVPVTCAPLSGSTFGLGSTTVTCSAADDSGNTATGTFTVTVRDTVAPSVSIVSPGRDALIAASPITVTVAAADLVGVTAVSVNGTAAALASGSPQTGTWTAAVPVTVPGVAMTFTVSGADGRGSSAAATIIVDNDGIASAIDRSRNGLLDQSSVYSSDFSDGTTNGTIYRAAGMAITAAKPPGASAVRLTAVSATGRGLVYLCNGATKYVPLDGGEAADVTCTSTGTVTMKAVAALPSIELWKQVYSWRYESYTSCYSYSYECGFHNICSGRSCSTTNYVVYYTYSYSISLRNGESVSTGSPVTAGSDNAGPIAVTLMRVQEDGAEIPVGSFELDPGESADTQVVQGIAGSDDQVGVTALAGEVTATIGGVTRVVSQGDTSVFVTDLKPPLVSPVADLTIDTTAATGAVVNYSLPRATDNADPSPRVSGSPEPGTLFPVGETIVAVTAVDAAGNGSTVTFRITVRLVSPPVFAFRGFFAPIDNPPVVNRMKAGSAVPVKFSLTGYFGLSVFQAGYPVSQPVSCQSAAVDEVEQTLAAGASSLTYDASVDQYVYVWKTEKAWANTCRQLVLRFTDGTTTTAIVSMVK